MSFRPLLISSIAITSLTFSVQAAPLDGKDGLNMGNVVTGKIYNMAPILLPSMNPVAYPFGWMTPNKSLARVVVPVANLIGQKDDGSPMDYLDLIPFTTSSMFVVGGDGGVVLDSGAGGTVLGGKVTLLEPQGDISMGIYQ